MRKQQRPAPGAIFSRARRPSLGRLPPPARLPASTRPQWRRSRHLSEAGRGDTTGGDDCRRPPPAPPRNRTTHDRSRLGAAVPHRCTGRRGAAGHTPRQRKRSLMALSEAVRAGAEVGGAVVRQVGDRGAAIRHPVAEGPPALVGDLQGEQGEAGDLDFAGFQRAKPPCTPELCWRDGKVRRGHETAQHGFGVSL